MAPVSLVFHTDLKNVLFGSSTRLVKVSNQIETLNIIHYKTEDRPRHARGPVPFIPIH